MRMAKNTLPETQPPAFLTVAQAAEVAHVARRTVDRWVVDERFESFRPIASGSGRRLIDRASFYRFLGLDEAA